MPVRGIRVGMALPMVDRPPTEMEMRCVRRLFAKYWAHNINGAKIAETLSPSHEDFKIILSDVREVMREMRDPTEAMKDAGYRLDGGTPYDVPAGCESHWQAMIDAASPTDGDA